jgi:hypothetical protein
MSKMYSKLDSSFALQVSGDKNAAQNTETQQDKLLQHNIVL